MSSQTNGTKPSATFDRVTMDSRKFLSQINNSAQSQITFFEGAVAKLGRQYGQEWKLSSLLDSRLIFENKNGEYFTADYARVKGGKVSITNVKQVELTASGEKGQIVEDICLDLVNAIEEDDSKRQDSGMSRLAANRFRSTSVPASGVVRTRDGVVRKLSVNESVERLADRVVASLQDRTIMEGEKVVGGEFNIKPFQVPVSELTCRQVIARKMQQKAMSAFRDLGFQTLVESVAADVSNGKLEDAAKNVTAFAVEHQEFCLLTQPRLERLVGDTLATRAIFNESLAKDCAQLIYQTNLQVNRKDIVESWSKTAQLCRNDDFSHNVRVLAEAKDFAQVHDQFLTAILETRLPTDDKATANSLRMLADQMTSDPQSQQEVQTLAEKLEGQNPDDETRWQAKQLLAATKSKTDIGNREDLANFDAIPGSENPAADPAAAPAPVPPVNPAAAAAANPAGAAIPAPGGGNIIINMGANGPEAAAANPAAAPAPEPTAQVNPDEFDMNEIDGLELETQAGDPAANPAAAGAADPNGDPNAAPVPPLDPNDPANQPPMEGLELGGAVVEDLQGNPAYAKLLELMGNQEPELVMVEGAEYPAPKSRSKVNHDYSSPAQVIEETVVNPQQVQQIRDLMTKNKVNPNDPNSTQHLDEFAGVVLANDKTLQNNPKAMAEAKKRLVGAVVVNNAQQAQQAAEKEAGTATVTENQIKSPTKQLARRGLKKAAINQLVEEGKLQWLRREDIAVEGEFKGVKFVLDHQEPPVVLSEDGSVELPIPENMVPGALYLAEVKNDEAEADLFVEWLAGRIESLRPVASSESQALQEAVAKVTISPDVQLSVEVQPEGDQAPVAVDVPPVISEPDPVSEIKPVADEPVTPPGESEAGEDAEIEADKPAEEPKEDKKDE